MKVAEGTATIEGAAVTCVLLIGNEMLKFFYTTPSICGFKKCMLTKGDFDSGKPVVIQILKGGGIKIVPPSSSSCTAEGKLTNDAFWPVERVSKAARRAPVDMLPV